MFGCLMFCDGNSLYERDDRDLQCGQLLSRTKDIKQQNPAYMQVKFLGDIYFILRGVSTTAFRL
jgi:hypothetical protein